MKNLEFLKALQRLHDANSFPLERVKFPIEVMLFFLARPLNLAAMSDLRSGV